jgi:hypothetical protein
LANLAKQFHKLGGIKDIIESDIKNKFEKSEKARTAKIKVTKVNTTTEKENKLEEREPSDPSIRKRQTLKN